MLRSIVKRVSKKYSFALLTFALIFLSIMLINAIEKDEKTKVALYISTQVSIVLVAVTYLTGQAKIDMNVQAGANYEVSLKPNIKS